MFEFIIENIFQISKLIIAVGIMLIIVAIDLKRKNSCNNDNRKKDTNTNFEKIENANCSRLSRNKSMIIKNLGVSAIIIGIVLFIIGVVGVIFVIYVVYLLIDMIQNLPWNMYSALRLTEYFQRAK